MSDHILDKSQKRQELWALRRKFLEQDHPKARHILKQNKEIPKQVRERNQPGLQRILPGTQTKNYCLRRPCPPARQGQEQRPLPQGEQLAAQHHQGAAGIQKLQLLSHRPRPGERSLLQPDVPHVRLGRRKESERGRFQVPKMRYYMRR